MEKKKIQKKEEERRRRKKKKKERKKEERKKERRKKKEVYGIYIISVLPTTVVIGKRIMYNKKKRGSIYRIICRVEQVQYECNNVFIIEYMYR